MALNIECIILLSSGRTWIIFRYLFRMKKNVFRRLTLDMPFILAPRFLEQKIFVFTVSVFVSKNAQADFAVLKYLVWLYFNHNPQN